MINVNHRLLKSAILNLTKYTIPKHHEDLLNLGPKFVPTSNQIPTIEIVTSTELAAFDLSKRKNEHYAEKLRNDVIKVVRKADTQKIPSNLNRVQQQALRELCNSEELKVYPYDKGAGFVIIDKEDAKSKLREQLVDATECTTDPTNKLKKMVLVNLHPCGPNNYYL